VHISCDIGIEKSKITVYIGTLNAKMIFFKA